MTILEVIRSKFQSLFLFYSILFSSSALTQNPLSSLKFTVLQRSVLKVHWPSMSEFACKLHGYIFSLKNGY